MTTEGETTSKVCTGCGEDKALEDYSVDRRSKDGRQPRCKACNAAYHAANRERIGGRDRIYREANREKLAEYAHAYREANREKLAEKDRAWREANREEISERRRIHREANREEISEQKRAWREANREAVLEQKRAYREANREKIAEKDRAWREANREKIAEMDRAYREANPHRNWAAGYRVRCRQFGIESVVEDFTKADVIYTYGDRCFYCREGAFEHLDHDIPVSKGGPHTLENVRPSCADCNITKREMTAEEFLAAQAALDEMTDAEVESAIDAEVAKWAAQP